MDHSLQITEKCNYSHKILRQILIIIDNSTIEGGKTTNHRHCLIYRTDNLLKKGNRTVVVAAMCRTSFFMIQNSVQLFCHLESH